MKIALVGRNSRIATALCHSRLNKDYDLLAYSIRSDREIEHSATECDALVYLIGDTRTNLSPYEYASSVYVNAYLLARYLQQCNKSIAYKAFIYMSSAKIYDLFPDAACYMPESISQSPHYRDLCHIAEDIIDLANAELSSLDSMQQLIDRIAIAEEDKHASVYSYGKALGEIIVQYMCQNHQIIRPTYLYGYQEQSNEIYSLIKQIFGGNTATIESKQRDFVTYNTLVDLLENIFTQDNKGARIINLASGDVINGLRLQEHLVMLADLDGISPSFLQVSRGSLSRCVDNSALIKKLSGINTYNVETFDDGFRQILYRYYIEDQRNHKVITELIGGSYARVYLACDEGGDKHIYKICLSNGAENGNIKIRNEARQLQRMNSYLKGISTMCHTPTTTVVGMNEHFTCVMQAYIDGYSFIDLLKTGDNNAAAKMIDDVCARIIGVYASKIDQGLNGNLLTNNTCRVRRRLISVREKNPDVFTCFDEYEYITINGEVYRNPLKVLHDLKLYTLRFVSPLGPCISGDLILDNVLIKDDDFVFIDARGEDLIWHDDLPFFDPYYDLAKIHFYFYGWKLIREENFALATNNYTLHNTSVTIKFIGNYAKHFEQLTETCIRIFAKYRESIWPDEPPETFINKILLLSGMHFLSDTYPRIVGKGRHILDQCLCEYALGVTLVNQAGKALLDAFERQSGSVPLKSLMNAGENDAHEVVS